MYNPTEEEYEKLYCKKMRGHKVTEPPKDYVLFDLETTGKASRYDEIIEIGAIKVRDNQIIDTYNQLIKPKCVIEEYITRLNHITNEMVANCPSLEEVFQDFIDFIGDDILVGQNIEQFDMGFICRAALECYGKWITNDYLDTLYLARRAIKDSEHHSIKALIAYFGLKAKQKHRALSDCEVTKQIYDLILEKVKTEGIVLYKPLWKRTNFSDITATVDDIDPDNPIYDKTIVITGTLSKCERAVAAQEIVNRGGIFKNNITKDVDYLVVADTKYRVVTDKILKVREYQEKGCEIEVIPESTFYDMMGI